MFCFNHGERITLEMDLRATRRRLCYPLGPWLLSPRKNMDIDSLQSQGLGSDCKLAFWVKSVHKKGCILIRFLPELFQGLIPPTSHLQFWSTCTPHPSSPQLLTKLEGAAWCLCYLKTGTWKRTPRSQAEPAGKGKALQDRGRSPVRIPRFH